MAVDLFAGVPVTDYNTALVWYQRLLGSEPAYFPNSIEAVWEIGEHGYLYIKELPDRAGHALHLIFVEDLDGQVEAIRSRGVEPSERDSLDNGVSKVIYRDLDGNEICFGGRTL